MQIPDEEEIRACGWYMRRTRGGPAVFLGHSAAAAEIWLRRQVDKQTRKKTRTASGSR